MKIPLFAALMLLISICLSGQNVYYVQDTAYNDKASDLNPGTDINLPWATWQKAFNTAQAGDTVYFRGGVWYPKTKAAQGFTITRIDPKNGYGHNGTRENPICFFAYPQDFEAGNFPVLDCRLASQTTTSNFGLGILYASNIKFKGLTICNVIQYTPAVCCGISGADCGNLWFENVRVHHINGEGIWIRGYDTLHFTNCDSYRNFDPLGDAQHIPGGMGDGFLFSSRAASSVDSVKTIYITGCRAWENSDDGFDLNVQEMYLTNSWSWSNGKLTGGPGGIGFKTNTGLVRDPEKKIFRNCISAYNQYEGGSGGGLIFANFEAGLGTICSFNNNFSYRDDRITASKYTSDFELRNYNVQFSNNIAFQELATYIGSFDAAKDQYKLYPYAHLRTNSIIIHPESTTGKCVTNPSFTVTDDDFLSLDTAVLRSPRKKDGSLPDIVFANLKATSDLVDSGTDVGLAFNGNAPDLGPFESTTVPGTSNKYPTVVLVEPKNSTYLPNKSIIFLAEASDSDGTISKVEFFCDNDRIGESNSEPWTFTWSEAPLGSHRLRAVATDNNGAKSTSAAIKVSFFPSGMENISSDLLFPNPNDGIFSLFLSSPLKRTSSIMVLSNDGKILYEDKMASETRIKEFNLPWLKPGLYLFLLSSPEVIFTKLFIKK